MHNIFIYYSILHNEILFQTYQIKNIGDFYIKQLNDLINSLFFFLEQNKVKFSMKSLIQDTSNNGLESTSSSYLNKKRSSNDVLDSSKTEIQKVKLIKNNKIVYVSESSNKNLTKKNKQQKKFTFVNRGQRGSRYRGVSKNGNQWQVLIMINKSKSYVGSYATEDLAARIYDIVSLKNHGNKAKTNFNYSKQEIKQLITLDVKDKMIQEQIDSLFNQNSIN